ncbi:hypothetical protein RB195_002005 [Necator americanus]|uniref:Integrase zinc-binding domain-containing protein n=1 Tax=Necator americanus TaxID=51031 RepID=A0ABR1DI10_NECAM
MDPIIPGDRTMATVRQGYWVPKRRQQIYKMIQKCVRCRRFNDLLAIRYVGLDFFDLPTSNQDEDDTRAYECIFTCTITRLIYLEMVASIGVEQDTFSAIHPVDFLQKNLLLTPPADLLDDSTLNPDYLPPQELRALQNRHEVADEEGDEDDDKDEDEVPRNREE